MTIPDNPTSAQTPSSSPPSTHLCLLRIPELAELIFQHLPPRDLLLAQRVCRTFYATIHASPTLQQCLFFAPKKRRYPRHPQNRSSSSSRQRQNDDDDEAWETNPLLAAAFPPWFQLRYVRSRWDWPQAATLANELPWAGDPARVRAFMRPEASWRRMLVTQPPLRDVQLLVKCDHVRNLVSDDYVRFVGGRGRGWRGGGGGGVGGDGKEEEGDGAFGELLDDAPGVTMGFLYDITQDFVLEKHVVSNFFIQWRPFLPPDTGGYVSEEEDEDEGFIDQPDDVCGFGTPSWRRRDEEPRDMLAIHLSYTAQRNATFLPTRLPQLRSKGYKEISTYRKLLDISARFIASEGSRADQPTDFYETCEFLHKQHGDTMLTWDMACIEGSKFGQFPWTYNAQINYRGETWK